MTTKQDKTPALSIHLGGGFRTSSGGTTNRYPSDRLEKFLNVDPNSEAEIIDYCNSYRFIPRDLRKGVVSGFNREHKELSEMTRRLTDGTASNKDLEKLDKIRNTIKTQTMYVTGEQLVKTRYPDTNYKYKSDDLAHKYLISTTKHGGTIVSLWEDLAKKTIGEQNIQTCANCGKFFFLQSKHKRKFCGEANCKNTYNKRKRRTLVKNQLV